VEVALAQKDVDPAALLIAVFVAIAGEVLSPGGWAFPDTIVAGVVLVIVLAFSRPTVRQLDKFQLIALSLVVGAIFAVAVSWPVQKFYVIPHWHVGTIQPGADRNADRAGYIGFVVGLVVAVVYAAIYWPRKRTPDPDANVSAKEAFDHRDSLERVASWIREQYKGAEPPSEHE
jgi:lysylphosphatidylglycerol synthetase-like protein (DUF2156 family)